MACGIDATTVNLPSFNEAIQQLVRAERSGGWLAECDDAGRYLSICREFVEALASVLNTAQPVLEVGCGCGELATALRQHGISVIATDIRPTDEASVIALSADQALQQYQPRVVIASFPPIDAMIDEAVHRCATVQQYIVLQADINGPPGLGKLASWRSEPLEQVRRWMITRHDVWTGQAIAEVLHHGQAWRFRRDCAGAGELERWSDGVME